MLKNAEIIVNQKIASMIDEGKKFNDFFSSLSDMDKAMTMAYMSALADKESAERKKGA